MNLNNKNIEMATAAEIKDNRLYIPVKAMFEILDVPEQNVKVDSRNRSDIYILNEKKKQKGESTLYFRLLLFIIAVHLHDDIFKPIVNLYYIGNHLRGSHKLTIPRFTIVRRAF